MEGRTAFMIGSAEEMETLRASMGANLDYTAIPAPDNYSGRPFLYSGSWVLAIPGDAPNREEALSFVSFLLERGSVLAGGWAITENGNYSAAQDGFYSKAGELYAVRRYYRIRNSGVTN